MVVEQQHLSELLEKACSCKDTPETRAAQLDSLLTLLIASSGQAWFQSWLDVKLASIYPRPSRTLLDAVLQAFIAASPLHCSYVLPTQLSIPGSTSLNAPLRRDIAVLFRPNQLLSSCWANQGVVCCSIVSFLATVAAERLHKYQQSVQHQQLTPNSSISPPAAAPPAGIAPTAANDAAGRLGTVVGWLTDCLLQADPQHKLHFMQLAVATAVHRYSALEQQQEKEEAGIPAVHEEPPAKRRRLQEHCTQQTHSPASTEPPAAPWPSSSQLPGQPTDSLQGTAHSTPNSSGNHCQQPSPQAVLAGLQLLATICSCEAVQRNSHQLMAPAAVVAAEATAAQPGSEAVSLDSICTWLFKRLSSLVSSAATTAAGGASVSSSSAVSTPSVALAGQGLAAGVPTVLLGQQQQQRKQQQQQLGLAAYTPPGLTPTAALQQVVQCMAAAGPQVPLQLACILMYVPLPATAAAAASTAAAAAAAQSGATSASAAAPHPQTAGGKQTHHTSMQHADHPAAAAAAAVPGSGAAQAAVCDMLFCRWLPEAAKQWRQTPAAAAGGGGAGRGRGRGGRGFHKAAAGKAPAALGLEQLLPEAPAVSASWLCKHLVPCLCQQALKEWQQQQQGQQQQEVSTQGHNTREQQPGQLQQSQEPSGGVACGAVTLPAAAALVQLLAADGLLLPASGEAPVAARALADALESLPRGLQHHVAAAWEQQLLLAQSHQGSAAAGGAASRPEQQQAQEVSGALLPWQTLQPMLCLVSNIPDPGASPVAELLATALCSCVSAAAGRNVPSMPGPVAAAAATATACDVPDFRKILRHLLLPLRFKLSVPARVWLLKQLLAGSPAGVHGRLSAEGPDGRQQGKDTPDTSFAVDSIDKEGQVVLPAGLVTVGLPILQELEALLKHDCSAQLGQGLQLLAAAGAGGAATASDSQQGKAPGVALQEGQARDFADAVVQLVTQLPRGIHDAEGSAHMQVPVEKVVDLLTEALQAADAAAYAQLKALFV